MTQSIVLFLLALLASLALYPALIGLLARAGVGQQIREEGPQSHVAKRGTPTAGGILILLAASLAFFLGGELRKFDVTLFPGLLARLSLRAADKLQQTTSSHDELDVVARRKFFWRRQKTCRVACVQDQLPFEMFLTR